MYDFAEGRNAPFGLPNEDLELKYKSYIPVDYVEDSFIYKERERYDKTTYEREGRKSNVLKFLCKELTRTNSCKYYFVFSSSGLGKTTILINLMMKFRIGSFFWKRRSFYCLAFSEWRKVKKLSNQLKYNSVLLLDAIDEDFSLKSLEDLNAIRAEFTKEMECFSQVVITSRNQYFQHIEEIRGFIGKVGRAEERAIKPIVLCPFDDLQVDQFLKRTFPDHEDLRKAQGIARSIGRDCQHRQFLLSNIKKLIPEWTNNGFNKAFKNYHYFNEMLINWHGREEDIVAKKQLEFNAISKNSTWNFAKKLAKKILENEEMSGYSFEEVIGFANHSNLESERYLVPRYIVTRTYLILDVNDKYRFAHRSILEFFLAMEAIDNPSFDDEYFKKLNRRNFDFAYKIYSEKTCKSILDVVNKLNNLSQNHFWIFR